MFNNSSKRGVHTRRFCPCSKCWPMKVGKTWAIPERSLLSVLSEACWVQAARADHDSWKTWYVTQSSTQVEKRPDETVVLPALPTSKPPASLKTRCNVRASESSPDGWSRTKPAAFVFWRWCRRSHHTKCTCSASAIKPTPGVPCVQITFTFTSAMSNAVLTMYSHLDLSRYKRSMCDEVCRQEMGVVEHRYM